MLIIFFGILILRTLTAASDYNIVEVFTEGHQEDSISIFKKIAPTWTLCGKTL